MALVARRPCNAAAFALLRRDFARYGCRCFGSGAGYAVESWSETPYLELVLGLRPEGQALGGAAGSVLAAVRGSGRPHPGYYGRLLRIRLENSSSPEAREEILETKNYVKDFQGFWIPMFADLMGGDFHHYSVEVFSWLISNPMVLQSAKRHQLEHLYSMMISYAGVVGSLRSSRIWFDDLKAKGLRQSTRCCNALIIAYAKKGDAETAFSILEQMKSFRKGCSPDSITYYILIAMLVRMNDSAGLSSLLRDTEFESFRPDAMTFIALLCGYSKMGRTEDFERTRGEIDEEKVDAATYNALLLGYSRLDRLDELQECLRVMQRREMRVLSAAVAEEIAGAYSRNKWDRGLDLVVQVVDGSHGIVRPATVQENKF